MPTATVVINAGVTKWRVPTDWDPNNNTIELIGPGGFAAVGGSTPQAIGGGGGGGYVKKANVNLTPGATYSVNLNSNTWIRTDSPSNTTEPTTGSEGLFASGGENTSTSTGGLGGTNNFGGDVNFNGGTGGAGGSGTNASPSGAGTGGPGWQFTLDNYYYGAGGGGCGGRRN
jgi:hypothetical protein